MVASLALPMSALELRDAVRAVRPVDPRRLDRVLRVDRDRALIEVQAGASWQSVAAHPQAGALAAAHNSDMTVGRTVEENAPGPDGTPIVRHVESLTIVAADGELRRVSREGSPELFRLCVGGQGIFGTAYSVTLRLASPELAQHAAAATVSLAPAESTECLTPHSPPLFLLLPPERLEQFIVQARACCSEWHTEILDVAVQPTFAEDETLLRWAVRDYAQVRLHLAAGRSLCRAVRATQLRRALIDLALGCRGSFPIARTPEATRAQVEACYPMLPQVLAEKRRLDPAGRLVNAWYRHHRSLLARGMCEVRWGS